nr:hypothetical protein B0A51_15417 [Rachicladosporium sp. CCFEE 5018]
MADSGSATVVTSTADCGDSATKVDPIPESIRLCMFAPPSTPAESFERTANYAKGPEQYLKKALREDVFDQRKDLLSLPEIVDKDGYGDGKHKSHFENHIAKLFGKEAGLFFITGVQAQLAALKIHCTRASNPRVAWHVSCHLESAEERAYEELYGLKRILLGSSPDALPTVQEIKTLLELPADERPAVLLLELPNRNLGCATYTFDELVEISSACKTAGVVLHCDGARIWEIEPYYQALSGKTFKDIAQLFDTIYMSFYKALQSASGAILLANDKTLIADAKMWQRRAGGNAFSLAYQVIDSERGFNENIGTFARKREKMIEVTSGIKAATKEKKARNGQQIVQFMPDETTCCQTRTAFCGYSPEEIYAARDAVASKTGVRVLERVWPKQTLDEMLAMDRKGMKPEAVSNGADAVHRHEIEWMMMSVTEKIPTKTFVDGYVALCDALLAGKKKTH